MDTVGVGSLRSPFKPLEFYIFQGFFSKFNWKRGADWVPHELSPNYGDPRCQRLAALAVQTDTILFAHFALFSNSLSAQCFLERRNDGHRRSQRLASLAVQTDTILFAYFALFSNSLSAKCFLQRRNDGHRRSQRLAALAVQTDTMLVLFFLNFITSKSQIELERRNYFPPASIKMIDTPHAGQRSLRSRFKLTRLTRVKNRVPRLSSLQL